MQALKKMLTVLKKCYRSLATVSMNLAKGGSNIERQRKNNGNSIQRKGRTVEAEGSKSRDSNADILPCFIVGSGSSVEVNKSPLRRDGRRGHTTNRQGEFTTWTNSLQQAAT